MNYILFDGPTRTALLPFTFTRPVADIRIGILTIREKWEHALGKKVSKVTEDYLSQRYPVSFEKENMLVDASYFPDDDLLQAIAGLKRGQALFHAGNLVAYPSSEILTLEIFLRNSVSVV